MGSRAYIAKIGRDGTGRFVYLGHGCYPSDAGRILLEHYGEERQIDALIGMGSIASLYDTPEGTISYHRDHREAWECCRPVEISNGTQEFFETAYMPGPEWLYCWTPDGWLAAKVQADVPRDYIDQCRVLSPEAFQDWFDNNQASDWVNWRKLARQTQNPQPLMTVIEKYTEEQSLQKQAL